MRRISIFGIPLKGELLCNSPFNGIPITEKNLNFWDSIERGITV